MASLIQKTTEDEILRSPATRNLVREILAAAEGRDPLDAAADAQLAANILTARMHEGLYGDRKTVAIPGGGSDFRPITEDDAVVTVVDLSIGGQATPIAKLGPGGEFVKEIFQ